MMNETETKRYFGKIFFPDNLDKKIIAWLTVTYNSIRIEVPGHYTSNDDWPIILGEFNGLRKVTFLTCSGTGGISIGAGGAISKIRPRFFIEGIHIYNFNDLTFNKISVVSPALKDWITEYEWITEDNSNYKIPKYKNVINITIDNLTLNVNAGHSIRQGLDLHAKTNCLVHFESNSPKHINELILAISHFKKLILFLTNKDPEYEEIFLMKNDVRLDLHSTRNSLDENRFTQFIRIDYKHVKDLLPAIILKWYENKKLYPVIDLVLEKSFNADLSTNASFLNVCVATESFHRRFGKDKKKNPVHENKKAIIGLIKDEELLKWFNDKSSDWEKSTLQERLLDFKESIEYIMGDNFQFTVDEFINKVKQTRNDIAHEGEFEKRFSGIELFLASKIIEYVLRLEIFKLFGFDVNSKNNSLLNMAKSNINALVRLNKYNEKAI